MIALCDQRAFYASCETVFQPSLRNKPVIVLSNNDGCIVACNEIAKACGVQKFAPYFQQKTLARQKGIHVFSSNYALYGEISRRIMETLEEEVPRIEIYSIDEAFCDLDGIPLNQLKSVATRLKDRIWREQRIPMGVSIAPTKTLAKLGQYAAKKIPDIHGVCVLSAPAHWAWVAQRTPIEEVWGIGKRLGHQLSEQGIHTAEAFRVMPKSTVKKLGGKPLERTQMELNGVHCIPFEWEKPTKQQIVCSRSFGRKLITRQALEEAISEFATRAAEKLRRQKAVCGQLGMFITTSRHITHRFSSKDSTPLPFPTDDTRLLISQAKALLRKHYQPGFEYAKCGVILSNINEKRFAQSHLWSPPDTKSDPLMSIIDQINQKYGAQSITFCAQGYQRKHAMSQKQLSPNYLTSWDELPVITL